MKYNESTPQRPEGDRVLNAPVVSVNIPEYIQILKSESTWKESDRNAITLYKTDKLQHVLVALHPGATLPDHQVNNSLTVHVYEGEIDFTVDGRTIRLKAGSMICLYPKMVHAVSSLSESVILLTVSGRRE